MKMDNATGFPKMAAASKTAKPDSTRVQSVVRAFHILELLSESADGRSLSELVALTRLPAATVHRLLHTMSELGYARQEPSHRYNLGFKLRNLSRRTDFTLSALARPYLESLVDAIGETANLAVLDGDHVLYVAQVPSPHPMRMFTEVGHRAFLHSTGVGKAILSTLPSDYLAKVLEHVGLPMATERTITTMPHLLEDIKNIHAAGYAIDNGEHELGVRCFAVPVTGLPNPTAISVSGPAVRLTRALTSTVIPLLQNAAKALSRSLQ